MERLSLSQQLDTPSTFFGLTEPENLLACMKSTEHQIDYLRRVAALKFSEWDSEAFLIRFMWRGRYAYASALPRKSTRLDNGGAEAFSTHERWYFPAKTRKLAHGHSRFIINRDYPQNMAKSNSPKRSVPGSRFTVEHDGPSIEVEDEVPTLPHERTNLERPPESWHNDHQFFARPRGRSWIWYNYVFGDFRGAALIVQNSFEQTRSKGVRYALPESVPLHEILWCFNNQMFSVEDPKAFLDESTKTTKLTLTRAIHSSTTSSLAAFTDAYRVYQKLPDATIDLGVLNRSLSQTKWARHQAAVKGNCFSQSGALSCLAYFEDGRSDIDPEVLEGAFAMSSGDSIYISERVGLSLPGTDTTNTF
jgi:hypothetical protein